jgi:hypothetical protein
MTIHTPNAGTGLTGSWHVSRPITVRADLALCPLHNEGSLGGVGWITEVGAPHWDDLAGVLWRKSDTGRRRLPSKRTGGTWRRFGHVLATACDSRVVAVPTWTAPVLYRPDGTPRACRVVTTEDGVEVVLVYDAGDVVAFIPSMRRLS